MACVLVAWLIGMGCGHSQAQEKVDAKAQANVDALEKVLAEYEQAAAEFEKSLEPFAASKDSKIVASVDSARLQILSIRSVRKIIRDQPSYLQWHVQAASLERWKDGAVHFLAAANSGVDPFAGMTSGVRPFRSKIDNQLLLYKIALPKDYNPAQKYPLRIELHAGGGFSWLAYWVSGKPDMNPRAASSDGAIHISPAGRQHVGMGEVAILEAIADVQKNYSVDADRITIGGASWGGTGGFHFATFLPDRFAAAHSLTGGGNYNLPIGNGRYDAYMLSENLANLPFLIWDTPVDGHYKANHAFADDLRDFAAHFKGFYPHLELTDPKGGHGIIDKKLRDEGEAWLNQQTRQPYPPLVVYKTYWLRYDGAYWAHIDTMEVSSGPARIVAQMTDGDYRVDIENADCFHLDLAPQLVGSQKKVAVNINGGPSIEAPAGQTVYFWKTGDTWKLSSDRYPQGLVKKHGLSGPIQDVFMEHPVMIVHGEKTTAAMLDDMVDRLISTGDGSGVLRTGFERKTDANVSDSDLAEKNLILVGTPQQNRFLAKIADKLPVKLLDDGFQIAGKEYRGADVSLAMVYPNPLNPSRYVLLLPERYLGDRPLDYPDYVVFQASQDAKRPGRVVAKGLFDSRWEPK
jgi:pimeloyl-ACP methyl ester carboxylesterase